MSSEVNQPPSTEEHPSSTERHRMVCPVCERPAMGRIPRYGFLQTKVFPLFGYYPWECGVCRVVRLLKDRGASRSRRESRPSRVTNELNINSLASKESA